MLYEKSFSKPFYHVFTVAGHKLFASKPGLHGLAWNGGPHRGDGGIILQLGE